MLVNKHGIVVNSRINQLCRQRTPIYISLWKISFVQEFIFAPFGSLPDLHTIDLFSSYSLQRASFSEYKGFEK